MPSEAFRIDLYVAGYDKLLDHDRLFEKLVTRL